VLYVRKIVGDSMSPTFRSGSIVVAIKKKPRSGDIVLALVNGREITKRVSKISDKGVYLLGDNTAHSTDSRDFGYVSTTAIAGVVVWQIPFYKLHKQTK